MLFGPKCVIVVGVVGLWFAVWTRKSSISDSSVLIRRSTAVSIRRSSASDCGGVVGPRVCLYGAVVRSGVSREGSVSSNCCCCW